MTNAQTSALIYVAARPSESQDAELELQVVGEMQALLDPDDLFAETDCGHFSIGLRLATRERALRVARLLRNVFQHVVGPNRFRTAAFGLVLFDPTKHQAKDTLRLAGDAARAIGMTASNRITVIDLAERDGVAATISPASTRASGRGAD